MEEIEHPSLDYKEVIVFHKMFLPRKAMTFWSPMYGVNLVFIYEDEGEEDDDDE